MIPCRVRAGFAGRSRRLIGADPALIRPGAVLALPPAASSPGARRGPAAGGTPPAHGTAGGTAGGTPGARSAGSTPGTAAPGGTAATRAASPGAAAPGGTGAAGVMPRWLKAALLAVAALTLVSFLAQPAVVIGQRRRRAAAARGAAARAAERRPDRGQRAAATMARIVQADHERLIVTYCVKDDTVYLLTPPGEDPRAVLRAARLILHEDTYQDLADHLGVPAGWQRE